MEEQILHIVPFGKYKDNSLLDLLADEEYVNWLKQQSWFSNQKQIYNIVVHQTIPTTNNSKTPEHNKLQNLFLDASNQKKLLSKLFKKDLTHINNLFKETDIIRCFGKNIIPEFINKLDNTTIKFEDKFNWDLVIYYKDCQNITIISNLETELFDKIKYKEQYDIKQQEIYKNEIQLYEEKINIREIIDKEEIKEFENQMREYLYECEKYENDLNIYLQQRQQNEKDIAKYEKKLNVYQSKQDEFIRHQTELICQELEINYDEFMRWKINSPSSVYNYVYNTKYTTKENDKLQWIKQKARLNDYDTKHTTEEKKQLREIVNDKLKPFIKVFEEMNTIPILVEKLNIPTKPLLPEKKYNFNGYSVDTLNEHKKDYENKYKKDYENNFNKHYEKYRLQYYIDIIEKYYNETGNKQKIYDNRDNGNDHIEKINDNQYKILIDICNYDYAVCCELKPTLSDDYPVVLRKLKTQIELTRNDKTNFKNLNKQYILIIGSFTSIDVSKEQLITIFKQSNIKIIFTDEIFETSKSVAIKYVNTNTSTEQILFENKLIEENKFLKDNLLQTQQKLLQAEEKIKQLEEEIQLLKS